MENTGKYYMGNEKYGHPHANVMFFTSDSSRTVSEIVGGKQYTITFNFQKVGEHGETDIYAVPHMSFMGDDNNKLTKALLSNHIVKSLDEEYPLSCKKKHLVITISNKFK